MKQFEIRPASFEDKDILCEIFFSHITAHPEYISHGEMQMGVGLASLTDGEIVASVAPEARHIWLKYIQSHFIDRDYCMVYKAVTDDDVILGFCVADVFRDGEAPFGMVSDLLVKEDSRGSGVGSALLDTALEWLRSREVAGIYLESGLKNHAAHEYFMRRGFCKVSEVYKLM